MMFALVSQYTLPAGRIAELTPAHSEWIAGQYALGRILVSGRGEPATGGVIVARGDSVEEIMAWISNDPFTIEGAATYQITAFHATDHPKRSAAFDVFEAIWAEQDEC
jgi:uncharacterized protein YciI